MLSHHVHVLSQDLDQQLKSWDDIDLEQLEATSSEEEVEVVFQRGRLRAPPQEGGWGHSTGCPGRACK